jgi:hypothetical protein
MRVLVAFCRTQKAKQKLAIAVSPASAEGNC